MTDINDDRCLIEAELRARARYAEPARYYHDQRHLDDCLELLEGTEGIGDSERRLLRWAILWHDAVYDPKRSDNEEQSAELARRELVACGVPPETADEVARLILLTKGHKVNESDRLGAMLASIDLSVLGSSPDRYQAYASDVRREYAHVPDAAWRVGRTGVLRYLLEADPLYPAADFRERLEPQAKENLQREIKQLEG